MKLFYESTIFRLQKKICYLSFRQMLYKPLPSDLKRLRSRCVVLPLKSSFPSFDRRVVSLLQENHPIRSKLSPLFLPSYRDLGWGRPIQIARVNKGSEFVIRIELG